MQDLECRMCFERSADGAPPTIRHSSCGQNEDPSQQGLCFKCEDFSVSSLTVVGSSEGCSRAIHSQERNCPYCITTIKIGRALITSQDLSQYYGCSATTRLCFLLLCHPVLLLPAGIQQRRICSIQTTKVRLVGALVVPPVGPTTGRRLSLLELPLEHRLLSRLRTPATLRL
jgi:hypothetical protein